MTDSARVHALVARVEAGDLLSAFEEFYAEEVVMQENFETPTVGKAANRERERAFVASLRDLPRGGAVAVMIGGDQVAIRWRMTWHFKDGSDVATDQIGLQTWRDGRIVHERFYYDPAAATAAAA